MSIVPLMIATAHPSVRLYNLANLGEFLVATLAVGGAVGAFMHKRIQKRKAPAVEQAAEQVADHARIDAMEGVLHDRSADGMNPAKPGLATRVYTIEEGMEEMRTATDKLDAGLSQCNSKIDTIIYMLSPNGKNSKNPGDQIAITRDEIADMAANQKAIMEHLGIVGK